MSSAGMDRETGRLIHNFDHVAQSIGDVLTTGIGQRAVREWYGFPGLAMLGENMNHDNLVKFFQIVAIALSMRQKNGLPVEPRFRVIKIVPLEALRSGEFACRLEGEYLPRGHLGDFTPAGKRRVVLSGSGSRFTAVEEAESIG
ncbi:baseplate assembly protein [Microvirga brassicacearum]|uniref:Baseplate assembly protein n=1 Tax=Microvirga brassicacearum TaxID=2580413 RepID=A0A5N3PHD3_9HYPH|nr:baseplate assembly protein [Microvirga brassicacearum]KAB0269065.1 baseplate assembly protein [Microvirga brassicacearum]